MSEHYKIERTNYEKTPNEKLANEMILWGKIMGNLRMVPYVTGKGWAGNIGFRKKGVIWVTPSGGEINDIKVEDVIGITEGEDGIVFFGDPKKKPTSEWEIYWDLFKKRQDINAILHGHDPLALETAEKLSEAYPKEVALTKSLTEAGSPEFRDEVLEIVTDTNTYLIGKEHGFFALGRTFEEAGLLALEFRSRASELMMGQGRYRELLNRYHIA